MRKHQIYDPSEQTLIEKASWQPFILQFKPGLNTIQWKDWRGGQKTIADCPSQISVLRGLL